ncbi:MAG: 2,3-diphosphoglycerate-dependent phosphoglycerate mutase, partial [Chloroflexota bacterium]|nr:2,3-diphosphoglycerate-dependent phosphoglycerate mutase [Chloroflexota bacterium]
MDTTTLCLLRHGQSQWNLENRFTGWVDIPLSEAGREEAREAGLRLKAAGLRFQVAFTSVLIRAIETLEIVLRELGQTDIPVMRDQALNERMYGDLQGLNKAETAAKFGEEQVHIWRRSYDVPPPGGESLKDTQERAFPYFQNRIRPELAAGKTVLVSAHGNSLRAIVMALESLTPEQIVKLEIPTGVPWIYRLDSQFRIVEKIRLESEAG